MFVPARSLILCFTLLFTTNKVSSFLLSLITGDSNLLPVLTSVSSLLGLFALVHTEDVCNAHLYLMEHDQAKG